MRRAGALEALTRLLPDSCRLCPPCTHTRTQALHRSVNARITAFQAGVATRAAARAADPRWLHEKVLAALGSLGSWEGVRAAASALRPSPWGAVVALMVGSFVRSVVEQFAQSQAVEADRRAIEAEAQRLLKQGQ